MSNFNFSSILSSASNLSINKQNIAAMNNPTAALIKTMQGLDSFANRGKTALINVESASKMWLSEDLMEEYIPCSFHWQLPSDTTRIIGVCVVGMPFSLDANGFQPAPKSEWDATLAQGNGQTSRLMAYFNKATKSWVEYPVVRPDFAGLGFLTKNGQVFEDQLVKHPYEPSQIKQEGAANWSIKLTRFNPGDSEGADEWAELAESMAANIREYAGVGHTRHFGYMLMVGFVTDVHLHLPSNAKKEGSDEYEYDQKNGQMLSVTMPIFGCYVRPLTWRLDHLHNIDAIKGFVHKDAACDPDAKSVELTAQVLNKMPVMIPELESTPPVVRVTTDAPPAKAAALPSFWKDLHILRKLAICHKLSNNLMVVELALEVIKGKDFDKALAERGLKTGFLVGMVLNKNLLPLVSQFTTTKAEAYFLAMNKSEMKAEEIVQEVVSVQEVPAVPAAQPKCSLIKRHDELADEEENISVKGGGVIKPTGAVIVGTPQAKSDIKRSELDDYAVKRSSKIDLNKLAELSQPKPAPANQDEVNAVTYQKLNLDDFGV